MQRLMLGVLALEVNQPVALDRLVELGWPESPPRTAAHAVMVGVSRLRKALSTAGVPREDTELIRKAPGTCCAPIR
jgi:ABC-2 type transport system ATP-binding protein